MRTKVLRGALAISLAFCAVSKAQLAGTYSVPATFTSLAAAINSLNVAGVSAGVTVYVAAGYTEVAPTGGYTLNAITGASATSPIVFMKFGAGVNPKVTAYTGTATPASAAQDGVWRFIGSDYITVDGIDIADNATTNPATMEFGYGFFRGSVTDGCQNNTVKNCTITLNRVNNAAGSGPALAGSRGIDVVNSTSGAHVTALTISSAAGANSNNRFYSNLIQNCNIGIALVGYAAATPFTLADAGNDIGGVSAATSNTILNFGGGGTTSGAAGIQTLAQYNLNVSYNIVNSNNGSGVNHAAALNGILINAATSADVTITNNTVTVRGGGTTATLTAIENNAGSTAASNSVVINNNLITSCTYSTATSGAFTGISNTASSASVTINGNRLVANSTNGTTATNNLIINSGAATSSISISTNSISTFTLAAGASAAGTLNHINNTGGTSAALLAISGNTITSVTHSGAGSTAHNFIRNTAATLTQTITSNAFVTLALNTTGSITFIGNNVTMLATGLQSVSGNSIITSFAKNGAGGTVTLFTSNASSAAGSQCVMTGNNFSNITLTGATTMAGWVNTDGGSPSKTVSANVFSGWNCGSNAVTVLNINFSGPSVISSNTVSGIGGTGAITGLSFGASNSGSLSTISSNLMSSFTSSNTGGAVLGLNILGTSVSSLVVQTNTVRTLSSTGAAVAVTGLQSAATASVLFNKNKVVDLQGTGASGTANGILVSSGTTTLANNVTGDIRLTNSSAANPLNGINLTGGTAHTLVYNSVYLNAASAGANFGASALNASTTPSLIAVNNIFVNLSTPKGTGTVTAFRRSNSTLSTYLPVSNNNLFYGGIPALNCLLFTDGTNYAAGIADYKTFMGTRDQLSVTENPTFVSTAGTNASFLSPNTTVGTQIEGGAQVVSLVADDIFGTPRSITAPDIGAIEGNFTPFSPCTGAPAANASQISTTLACTNATALVVLPISHTLSGITYQWYASNTGSLGTFNSIPNATNAVNTVTVGSSNTWIQAVLTCSAGGSSTSAPVQVVVGPSVLSAAAQANFTSVCSGQSTTLSLVNATGPQALAYDWQASTTSSTGPFSSINNTLTTATGTNITTTTWYQAVISCSATPAFSIIATPVQVVVTSPPSYAPVPFLENFNNTWQNRCDLRNVPVTANWSSNPTTGQNSWRRQDDAAAAGWTTTSSGIVTPLQGAGAANFHTWDAPSGTAGELRLYVDLSTSTNYSLSFYHINTSGTDSLEVFFSTNAGASFSKIGSYVVSSAWAKKVINLGTVSSPSCIVSFSATSDYGTTDIGIDSLEIKSCPNVTVAATPSAICAGTSATLSAGGVVNAASYLWNTSATATAIAVSPTATTIYTVTGSNGLCAVSRTVQLIVNPLPTVNITGPTGVCVGESATLTANGASTYSWSTASTNTSIVVSPTVTSTYTVVGYTPASCTAAAVQTIAASASLPVGIVGSSTVCAGQSITLTGTGAVSYTWTGGPVSTSIVSTPSVNTDYTVTGASGTCSNSAILSVTVLNIPTVAVSGASVVCAGTSITLTASGANTYTWSNNTTNTTLVVAPTSNTVYSLVGKNTAGCTSSASLAVTANTIPVISVAQNSSAVCYSTIASFTASGANTYTWTGGPQLNIYTVTPTASGVYTVTGTSIQGCISSKTVAVTVNVLPTISVVASAATVCANSIVGFTASGASTYTWNGVSSAGSVTYTPAANAVYTVIGSSAQGCTSSATIPVATWTLPVIGITPLTATVCTNSPASFTASGASTYTWSGNTVAPTASIYPSATGVFSVTGSSTDGCNTTYTFVVTALPLPTIGVTPSDATVCVQSPATFTASGALTYTWMQAGVPVAAGPTAAIVPTTSAVYHVFGTSTLGCVGSTFVTVFTNSLPVVTAVAPAGSVCVGAIVTVTASGAQSYTWSTGGTGQATTVMPTSSTVYTVTGTDALNGCKNSATVAVSTRSLPLITIAPSSPTVCPGTAVSLLASGVVSYTWSDGGGLFPSALFTPTANTVYSVTGEDAANCLGTATVPVSLYAAPQISIGTPGSFTVCAHASATLTASGAISYTWLPFNVNVIDYTFTPVTTITYTLVGTDANGCDGSATAKVVVDPCTGVGSASAPGFALFPNPSTGSVTIIMPVTGTKRITILNAAGAMIQSFDADGETTNVDMTAFAKGVYFITVSMPGNTSYHKLIRD